MYQRGGDDGWKHDYIVCAVRQCIAAPHSGYGEDVHFFLHIWTDYEINALATEVALDTAVSRHGRVPVVGNGSCLPGGLTLLQM